MTPRASSPAISFGAFVVLAAGAVAAIYYGAIPWALNQAIAAILSLVGYR